jgi:methylmalonyl-CoA/ethylmalonyl-CoA epimerase
MVPAMSNSSDSYPFVLDHVAIGVTSAADVSPFLVGELGGREFASGPGAGFQWWQWQFERGGVIEVIEPHGEPGGFVHRFLASRGPGVHHVTFKVPDLAATAAGIRRHGVDVVGYEDSSPAWKEFFIHPKQAQGIVVQLAETHPELEPEGFARPFPAAATAAEPVDVTAVRLSSTSAQRARDQWATLLGGSCDEKGDVLRFRWPESPLHIVVEIDADAPEGPIAIELTGAPVNLPDGTHPTLGVRFVRV